VHVIDAKTMSPEPVAVVELPNRVPYGFHAFFVTEVCVASCISTLHFFFFFPPHYSEGSSSNHFLLGLFGRVNENL